MIDRSLEDEIDKSECIDWSETDPLIKPERKDIVAIEGGRGGVEYHVLSRASVISALYNSGYINENEFKAACDYQIWRDYVAGQLGARVAYLNGEVEKLTSEGITSFLHAMLLQRLKRTDQQIIDFALDKIATPHTNWEITRAGGKPYTGAFNRLYILMSALITAKNNAMKRDKITDLTIIAKSIRREFLGKD